MAGKKGVRPVITLACSECKERNYTSEKNRRNDPNRLEMQKYCRAAGRTRCTGKRSSQEINSAGAENDQAPAQLKGQ